MIIPYAVPDNNPENIVIQQIGPSLKIEYIYHDRNNMIVDISDLLSIPYIWILTPNGLTDNSYDAFFLNPQKNQIDIIYASWDRLSTDEKDQKKTLFNQIFCNFKTITLDPSDPNDLPLMKDLGLIKK